MAHTDVHCSEVVVIIARILLLRKDDAQIATKPPTGTQTAAPPVGRTTKPTQVPWLQVRLEALSG